MSISIQLGIIFFFALLGGILAVRFKLPTVLGLLFVGALIGPHAFGLVTDMELIEIVIDVGAILLLFIVGIEFNLEKLLGLGTKALIVASIKLAIVFFGGYHLALLFGLGSIAALYTGVILAITSTVIVIKVLEQKGMATREELPLLIAVLIIEDIFAVFALTFFSGLDSATAINPTKILITLITSLAVLLGTYFILLKLIKKIISWVIQYSAEDTFTFISLGLCVGMSYLAHIMQLSPSVGAFLAGSILASLPEAKKFEHAIHPFILTFTSLFFLSIGTLIDSSALLTHWLLIAILLAANILLKYGSIGFGTYLSGFTGRQAVFSGIAMLSVGEFSLLIAKEASGLQSGIDFVSITAAIIVLSTMLMSFSVPYTEQIYAFTKKVLPKRVYHDLHFSAEYLKAISLKMLVQKIEMRKMAADWQGMLRNMSLITSFIVGAGVLWAVIPTEILSQLAHNKVVLYGLLIITFVFLSIPSFRIFQYLKDALHCIENIFVALSPQQEQTEKKIAHSMFLAGSLFLLSFITSNILLFFHVPYEYHVISGLLLLASIFYGAHSFSLINASFTEKRQKHKKALLKSKLF